MIQADISRPEALVQLLQSVLTSHATAAGPAGYLAVVLTKPPETVLVLLPVPPLETPRGSEVEDGWPFLLFDSHARPASHLAGAHLVAHTTLEALGMTLAALWPAMVIEDADPMQMLMYNTIEATVLAAVKGDGDNNDDGDEDDGDEQTTLPPPPPPPPAGGAGASDGTVPPHLPL
jgi:hypothetical protein